MLLDSAENTAARLFFVGETAWNEQRAGSGAQISPAPFRIDAAADRLSGVVTAQIGI